MIPCIKPDSYFISRTGNALHREKVDLSSTIWSRDEFPVREMKYESALRVLNPGLNFGSTNLISTISGSLESFGQEQRGDARFTITAATFPMLERSDIISTPRTSSKLHHSCLLHCRVVTLFQASTVVDMEVRSQRPQGAGHAAMDKRYTHAFMHRMQRFPTFGPP